jgi:hypothetical protein
MVEVEEVVTEYYEDESAFEMGKASNMPRTNQNMSLNDSGEMYEDDMEIKPFTNSSVFARGTSVNTLHG